VAGNESIALLPFNAGRFELQKEKEDMEREQRPLASLSSLLVLSSNPAVANPNPLQLGFSSSNCLLYITYQLFQLDLLHFNLASRLVSPILAVVVGVTSGVYIFSNIISPFNLPCALSN
jgi:hypothetical protein